MGEYCRSNHSNIYIRGAKHSLSNTLILSAVTILPNDYGLFSLSVVVEMISTHPFKSLLLSPDLCNTVEYVELWKWEWEEKSEREWEWRSRSLWQVWCNLQLWWISQYAVDEGHEGSEYALQYLLATDSGQLQVFQDSSLMWAASLPNTPTDISVATFQSVMHVTTSNVCNTNTKKLHAYTLTGMYCMCACRLESWVYCSVTRVNSWTLYSRILIETSGHTMLSYICNITFCQDPSLLKARASELKLLIVHCNLCEHNDSLIQQCMLSELHDCPCHHICIYCCSLQRSRGCGGDSGWARPPHLFLSRNRPLCIHCSSCLHQSRAQLCGDGARD